MTETCYGEMRSAALQYGPQCRKVEIQQQVAIEQQRMHSSQTSSHMLSLDKEMCDYRK